MSGLLQLELLIEQPWRCGSQLFALWPQQALIPKGDAPQRYIEEWQENKSTAHVRVPCIYVQRPLPSSGIITGAAHHMQSVLHRKPGERPQERGGGGGELS